MPFNGLPLPRRDFFTLAAAALVPPHLKRAERQYACSPREASLAWFRPAGQGRFIHHGLCSLDGVHAFCSYKWGITGTEGFLAPKRPQLELIKDRGAKPMEMCVPLNPGRGYVKDEPRMKTDELMSLEAKSRQLDANLLVNVGPLGDGAVLNEDMGTLREFGRRMRAAEKRERS